MRHLSILTRTKVHCVISYTRYYRPLVYHHFCFNRNLSCRWDIYLHKLKSFWKMIIPIYSEDTDITLISNLIEMTVSTNVSLNPCIQYICTTLFQKYVRVFKTGKWDTVVAKSYFCYFSCLSAWNATFIPQLGEFDDDAFLLFFFPSQDTCICCQDKMIKGHLIVFYDMKYPVPLS